MAENLEAPTTIPSIFAGPDRPHPMASALPVWEAANILAHPGRFHWKLAEDGSLVYDNPAIGGKGRVIFWINGDPEQQILLSLGGAGASAALTAFDIRAAAVHLLYAAYATTLKRPWEEKFTITGQQLADDLDLILRLARRPAQLLVHIDWPARGKQEAFTIEQSRLWNIEVTFHGQKTIHDRERLGELEIYVKPGPWAKYFLNRQGSQEDKARHQYGYLTQNCLKAMMNHWQKHPGAVRLMIWLLFQSRVEMKSQFNVSTLLAIAYGREVSERAKCDRRRRSQLAKWWDNDLLVLHEYGFSLAFDPDTYPAHLQPEWSTDHRPNQLKRPSKYFDKLLQTRCSIRPPANIESALDAVTSRNNKRQAPRRNPLLTPEAIRAARPGVETSTPRQRHGQIPTMGRHDRK